MVIIGITGTLGSGKGMVAEYLASKHNFTYLSLHNFFAEKVLERGQAVNRENMTAIARELRTGHEPSYVLKELLKRDGHGGRGVVVESIRTIAEAQYLKSQGAQLWCVDAPLEIRYKRFIGRALPQDAVPFEKFSENDKADQDAGDAVMQNLPAVCQMADVTFDNGGTKDALIVQVEKALTAAGDA